MALDPGAEKVCRARIEVSQLAFLFVLL